MASGPPRNESLGASSAQVLRRVNELFDARGLPFPAGRKVRKGTLAKLVLAGRKEDEPPIGLPVARWVRAYSRHQISALEELDLNVVGDLDDLSPRAVRGVDPDRLDPGLVGEAAIDALVSVLLPHVN